MEKYYYKTEQDDVTCTELCEYSKHIERGEVIDIKIGSLLCKECEHNVAYDAEDKSIKCDVYSSFIENEKLKEENDARMKYIIKLTKENENLTEQVKQLNDEIFVLKGGL